MNRLWMLFAVVVLVAAVIVGWLQANQLGAPPDAVVLASATKPGCDAPGQLWLDLTNASDRTILKVRGTLSFGSQSADAKPAGNFELEGPLLSGLARGSCIAVDDALLDGLNRRDGWWLAWPTEVEFGKKPANPLNPLDQGFGAASR